MRKLTSMTRSDRIIHELSSFTPKTPRRKDKKVMDGHVKRKERTMCEKAGATIDPPDRHLDAEFAIKHAQSPRVLANAALLTRDGGRTALGGAAVRCVVEERGQIRLVVAIRARALWGADAEVAARRGVDCRERWSSGAIRHVQCRKRTMLPR
jgi:hypothetical protein